MTCDLLHAFFVLAFYSVGGGIKAAGGRLCDGACVSVEQGLETAHASSNDGRFCEIGSGHLIDGLHWEQNKTRALRRKRTK